MWDDLSILTRRRCNSRRLVDGHRKDGYPNSPCKAADSNTRLVHLSTGPINHRTRKFGAGVRIRHCSLEIMLRRISTTLFILPVVLRVSENALDINDELSLRSR